MFSVGLGICCRVFADQPPDLPGHQDDAGPDCAGQGLGPGAHPSCWQQGGPGEPARGTDRRGHGPGPDLGLPLCRGERQEPDERERGVCGNCAGDEHATGQQGPGNHLYLLRYILGRRMVFWSQKRLILCLSVWCVFLHEGRSGCFTF